MFFFSSPISCFTVLHSITKVMEMEVRETDRQTDKQSDRQKKMKTETHSQWRIQDSTEADAPTLVWVCKPIIWQSIFSKNCTKLPSGCANGPQTDRPADRQTDKRIPGQVHPGVVSL